MSNPITPGQQPEDASGEDQRIKLAREIVKWYDGGQWSDANAMNVVGHLAAAVRMLLEHIDQQASAAGPAQVTVPASAAERAAQLAVAMTADASTTPPGDRPWTAQDVIDLVLTNGLADLRHRYPDRDNGPGAPRVTPA